MKPVECTSAQTVHTSVTTNCKNYSRNVWRFWLRRVGWKVAHNSQKLLNAWRLKYLNWSQIIVLRSQTQIRSGNEKVMVWCFFILLSGKVVTLCASFCTLTLSQHELSNSDSNIIRTNMKARCTLVHRPVLHVRSIFPDSVTEHMLSTWQLKE